MAHRKEEAGEGRPWRGGMGTVAAVVAERENGSGFQEEEEEFYRERVGANRGFRKRLAEAGLQAKGAAKLWAKATGNLHGAAKGTAGSGGGTGGGRGAIKGGRQVKVVDLEVVVNQPSRELEVSEPMEPISEVVGMEFDLPFMEEQRVSDANNRDQDKAKEKGIATGVWLQFDEWFEKEEGFLLPKDLCWVPLTIDMKTTRKNEFGKVLVTVLNPKVIPQNFDVVIGVHYFELRIEVEKMGFDKNGDEMEIDQDNKDDGGLEEDREEDQGEDGRDGRETENQK
ncbi:hypothetical protein E2562_027844 [Oryza meyeriana var. granulata]|uniref:Uncharacterized protein n=1 Tax=Oryza meyeriana var. granulata TaxID=110450 RepID=A0A6G1DN75_9ORYZ|nr:hypothetical protein E2562_027844 [Oryza meyeriana var. granulata]